MKKRILTWAFMLFIGISSSFARTNEGIYDNIKTAFKKEFKNAEIIQWENFRVYSRATFMMNNKVMFAYYSKEGHLLAVTRNLLTSELPIGLMMDLKSNYAGYWITDLIEISGDEGSSYHVSLENPDRKLVLKSDNMIYWQTELKQNKNTED
jgi:hypothetical protein